MINSSSYAAIRLPRGCYFGTKEDSNSYHTLVDIPLLFRYIFQVYELFQSAGSGVQKEIDRVRSEEFHRKVSEARRHAFEIELVRLHAEAEGRAAELVKMLLAKDDVLRKEQIREAESTRRSEEESLAKLETEFNSRLDVLFEKKRLHREEQERLRQEKDAAASRERKVKEEDALRKAEEERRRQEEKIRLQREEFLRQEATRAADEAERRTHAEARINLERELRQKEEEEHARRDADEQIRLEREEREATERRRVADEDLRRKYEEDRVLEEEKLRLLARKKTQDEEEAKRLEQEERLARVAELTANAESYLKSGDIDLARIEIAKALVNDPTDAHVLELNARVNEAPALHVEESTLESVPLRKKRKSKTPSKPIKSSEVAPRRMPKAILYTVVFVALSVVVVFFVQIRKSIFPSVATLAVLPFTGTSDSPEEAIQGFGLADEIVKNLQRSGSVSILGFSTAQGLARIGTDPEAAIHRLGYPYVVTGTLTKSDLGITARVALTDSGGTLIWNRQYQNNFASLALLPAEIATDLANALGVSISEQVVATGLTTNVDAYEAYSRGRKLAFSMNAADAREASRLFGEAVDFDPSFAEAFAARAAIQMTMLDEGWGTRDQLLDSAREDAQRAIATRPGLTEGYLSHARVLTETREYSRALEILKTAERYTPHSADVHSIRASVFLRMGEYADALTSLRRAFELDPRNPVILRTIGCTHQLNRTPSQAMWYHETALYFVADSNAYIAGPLADAVLLDPRTSVGDTRRVVTAYGRRLETESTDYANAYRLGRFLQVSGNPVEGMSRFAKLEISLRDQLHSTPSDPRLLALLGLTLTRLGKFQEATILGIKASSLAGNDPVVHYKVAQMFSLQMYSAQKQSIDEKKREMAVGALREAVALHFDITELVNADFYNMYEQANFFHVIQESMR